MKAIALINELLHFVEVYGNREVWIELPDSKTRRNVLGVIPQGEEFLDLNKIEETFFILKGGR